MLTHLFAVCAVNWSWCYVYNQLEGMSLPFVYTSHIPNRMRHSDASKVHVNCVSHDTNNQPRRGLRGPLETFNFWGKMPIFDTSCYQGKSYDFSYKWHYKWQVKELRASCWLPMEFPHLTIRSAVRNVMLVGISRHIPKTPQLSTQR